MEKCDGIGRDTLDSGAIGVEDVAALGGRGRVVEVEHDLAGTGQGIERARDQVLAALAEDLDGDVGGNALFVDQATTEIEFRLRGGGKADLDFLKADLHEQVEELEFLGDGHGLGESLVAIAKINTAPRGGAFEGAVGPLAIG